MHVKEKQTQTDHTDEVYLSPMASTSAVINFLSTLS